jgi:thymidine kinase
MLTVITGTMGCGKTSKVIELATEFINKNVVFQVFNMSQDTRSPKDCIQSRSGVVFPSISVCDGYELIGKMACNTRTVILDEAQFCDESILGMYKKLEGNGINLIISGLQYSFDGKDFGYVNVLISEADTVYKYFSPCYQCGDKKADRVIRLSEGKPAELTEELVKIDADYKPVCRKCFSDIYKRFDI